MSVIAFSGMLLLTESLISLYNTNYFVTNITNNFHRYFVKNNTYKIPVTKIPKGEVLSKVIANILK